MRQFYTVETHRIEWAALAVHAPHFGGRKNRPSWAQKRGISYERKAQEHMLQLFPDTYVPSPWCVFRMKREPVLRWCQPDGFIVDIPRSRITVVEIKLRHMIEAYTQLVGIYEPVLKKIFPTFQFRMVEVTRFYDPLAHFPVPVQLVSDVSLTPYNRFAVHIWSGSEGRA